MKSKLSFLSMILTICMLISALASCSSGKSESTETQSTVTSDTSSEVTTDTESSKVSSTETISETSNVHTSETDTEESNESSSTSSVESTEESSETDTEKAEISLGGDYGNSILYADELKNGVQAYYPDGVAREDFVVENLDITAEFSLTAGNDPMLTYLKNKEGGTYLENTMDVFVRMASGKT